MSLLLHIIETYSKEKIITKLQKLYSLPRNPRAGNKSPMLFMKKPLCMGDLSPTHKIFIERPGNKNFDNIPSINVVNSLPKPEHLGPSQQKCLNRAYGSTEKKHDSFGLKYIF